MTFALVPRQAVLALALASGVFAAACADRLPIEDTDAGARDTGTTPDTGVADGGACQPKGGACATKCDNGYLNDAHGCATCQCKPPVTCGPVCAIYCQYGNVLDGLGCPTCQCNPPPTAACTAAECEPAPLTPSMTCSDGKTVAGPICLRDQTGACGWRFTQCPPAAPASCTPDKCTGPMPKSINFICPDGKTIAGPACVANSSGSCGWTVLNCPATCVDNVLCIKGYHWDSSVCACVSDPATGGCPPCPSGDVCVQQVGGTAQQIGSPPQTACEAPDAACLAKGGKACACLSTADGRCSDAQGICVCDNGVR